jgi:hypothetical protein
MIMPHSRFLLPLLLLALCPAVVLPQRGTGNRPQPPVQQAPASAAASAEAHYWAAQRSIESAIQQLEMYLKAHPDGERTATATQQLEVLRALSLVASLPEWTSMDPRANDRASQWRISSVERQPDRTRVTIEIRCPRSDGGECYFDPFDRHPLALVDNAGRFYPVLDAGSLPRDVRVTGRERAEVLPGQAVLIAGRSIILTVEFAPLAVGVVSVQIYYRDDNRAAPAKFSLPGRH